MYNGIDNLLLLVDSIIIRWQNAYRSIEQALVIQLDTDVVSHIFLRNQKKKKKKKKINKRGKKKKKIPAFSLTKHEVLSPFMDNTQCTE